MTPTPLKKGDTAKIAGMSAPIITKSWVIAKQWWAVKRDGVVIAPVERARIEVAAELYDTARGAGGFGSTGR